jgi:LuxR family transcriptional regulator, quorum-sensing system regulator BjaR1
LARQGKAARTVFYEASQYDIVEGYCIPIAGPEGDGGVFSVAVSDSGSVGARLCKEEERLQLFAARFHNAAVRTVFGRHRLGPPMLSRRQREVLTWAALGLSSAGTASRIGISAAAVNYHLGLATKKLGAANKLHAVALAIRQALI